MKRLFTEKKEEFVFVYDERITAEKMDAMLEKYQLKASEKIFAFCPGNVGEIVTSDLEGLLSCVSLDIVGVAISNELVEKMGICNEKLHSLQLYELICRYTEYEGQCLIIFDALEELPFDIAQEDIVDYAYLVKKYINRFHTEGLEQSLKDILTWMVQLGYSEMFDLALNDEELYEKIAFAMSTDSEDKQADKKMVKIFVATHVPFNRPKDKIYLPIHVGREGKKDLGYLGDNTGENISDLNSLYGELTGLFWMWKNAFDYDYVGLCHYRRYFVNEKYFIMNANEYCEILQNYDAIVPKHGECQGTYYDYFIQAHYKRDLDAVGQALEKLYPGYKEAYEKAMQGDIFFSGNMMVTSTKIMRAYAEWLFHIFTEAGEKIDVTDYDNYHKRVYGFLSEQMFYVFMLANHLNYCEVNVGISDEKAETKALKSELTQLMEAGKFTEAKQLLYNRIKIRPDLLLPGSDLFDDLKRIKQELDQY